MKSDLSIDIRKKHEEKELESSDVAPSMAPVIPQIEMENVFTFLIDSLKYKPKKVFRLIASISLL